MIGQDSGGLQFNGASSYVTFGANSKLGLRAFTLETWFKWTGGGVTGSSGSGGISAYPLITKGRGESEAATYNANYFFGIQSDGILAADMEEGPGGTVLGLNHPVRGVTTVTTDVWHHGAVTYDGTNWALYLDGSLEATLYVARPPAYDSIQHAALASALNSRGVIDGVFAGVMDEVRIWNYARSASDIADCMMIEIPSAAGLVARWSLNEGSGSVAYDSSGNGIDGTLINSPVWTAGYPFEAISSGWVAFNDTFDGPGTHANTTSWNVWGASSGSGLLKNIKTGEILPVILAVTQTNASTGGQAGAPAAGTPAYTNFDGYIDWNSAYLTTNSVIIPTNSAVRHTFSGLNPSKRYSFSGTAVRGIASYSNRWTRFEIIGADSFVSAHTTNVYTSAQLPGLLSSSQAAICTGNNTNGDMVVWNSINPGADGLFTIECARFSGTIPGQRTDGAYGFGLQALRLEESAVTSPIVRITKPSDKTLFFPPTNVAITAAAAAPGGVSNVSFYANNVFIAQSTNTPYSAIWSNPPLGGYQLTAVVLSVGGESVTSAPVNVTVTTNDNPFVAITAPAEGTGFMAPADVAISATATDLVGIASVNLLVNQVNSGQASTSPYNFYLSSLAAGDYQLEAVAVDAFGLASTSAAVNIRVTNNSPPTVALTSPTNNQVLVAPTNLTISAAASDPDGSIVRVALYMDGVILGERTSLPYSVLWSNVFYAGTHQFFAVATDNVGQMSVSETATVTVHGDLAPQVQISSPATGSTFISPTNVMIEATASDSDGTIAKVEFYAGTTRLGEAATPPYHLLWVEPGNGSYSLTAIATDNLGGQATSAVASITVKASGPITLAPANSVWLYNDSVTAELPGWNQLGFDDSAWLFGPAELGYGDTSQGRPEATVVGYGPDSNNKYITTYFRHHFYLPDPALAKSLQVQLQRDDGGVVYINGIEVFRSNMPEGDVFIGTPASGSASDDGVGFFSSPIFPSSMLVAGSNVVAVEIHQSDGGSTDISFDLMLQAFTTNARPSVAISSPADGVVFGEPADIAITAAAYDQDGSITNVAFYINGSLVIQKTVAPFTYTWPQVAKGSYELRVVAWDNWGARSTSAPVNVFVVVPTAPTVDSFSPSPGVVSNLSQITVNFSEPVDGVDAGDLLLNGVPASKVTGANATYTFTFPQPAEGVIEATWASSHGIRDRESPSKPFDGAKANETARFTLVDTVPPVVSALSPVPGSTVASLTHVDVTFSEPVGGVGGSDLLVNGLPASGVSGSMAGPYRFTFAQPPAGIVQLAWASSHGIQDFARVRNSFPGGNWSCRLAPGAVLAGAVVINEIMYQPYSGQDNEEWIELHNRTDSALDLSGWHFSKGISFAFASYTLPAHGYVVVCANLAAFKARHPAVTNVVGDWLGRLSNIDETLELQDANNEVINQVHYADEGDWASRVSGNGDHTLFNLTSVGTTATATVMGDYAGGDQMTISGADQAAYNGTFSISGVSDNGGAPITSFSYTMSSAPSSPATGYLRCRQLTDHSAQGWAWSSLAHGFGPSLELCNPSLDNRYGQNWLVSLGAEGTPGQPNSVLTGNLAPIISDVTHSPAIPKPADTVTVTARLTDEQTTGLSALLYYRLASTSSPGSFVQLSMYDDGLHGDGVANDGLFGAFVPPQANGAIVEFYVRASDAQGATRTWPAPAVMANGSSSQAANALYQVDDNLAPASAANQNQPFYRLIMTQAEWQRLNSISTSSDAAMNATFVALENGVAEIRYNAAVRIRGAGSRGRAVKNYRVNIPSDRRWRGEREINLNTQFIHAQLIGGVLAARDGMPAARGRVVQVRVNGVNLASSLPADVNWSQNSQGDGFGSYYHLEALNADWAARLLPENSGGNVYRGSKYPWNANLDYLLGSVLITNTGLNFVTYVNHGYSKASNHGENDWSDLFRLTWALNMVPGDAEYVQAVNSIANVELCMRYFALSVAVDYRESSLAGGIGDDYAMYRGTTDPRFVFLPHDFDTILGQGDSGSGNPNRSIWSMVDSPYSTDTSMRANFEPRFLRHPQFAPIYLRELKRMCDVVFAPETINPLLNEILGGWVPDSTLNNMKTFVAQRRAGIYAQLPLSFSLNVPLSQNSGFYWTTSPTVTLTGAYNPIEASNVWVSGVHATLSPWEGRWTSAIALLPGINRLAVEMRAADNSALLSTNIDIWYDVSGQSVSGTFNGAVEWTPANGPYTVSGSITVGDGATLTIRPGTTVFFGPGTTLTVSGTGRVMAEGTPTQHIRFTRVPGGGNWGSLDFIGASTESRLAYVDIDSCAGTTIGGHAAEIHVNGGSKVFFDHLVFANTPAQEYISFDGSSFIVQNSVFPTYPYATSAPEMLHGVNGIPAGGYGIFRGNYFGHTWGFNDTIDFTGGQRPGAILQFIGNVFDGAGDDHLDLDSTDAWIEGNIFMHAHRDTNRTDTVLDTSSSISGGVDYSGQFSEWTIINNLFYDVDHVLLNKGGSSAGAGRFVFVNNTVVHVAKENGAGLPADIAAFDFSDDNVALPDPSYGAGGYVAGNIIWDCPALTANYNPSNLTVIFDNNLLPMPWTGPGGSNTVADPLLNLSLITNVTTADWKTVKAALTPRPGSPALGTGIGGFDKGGLNPPGLLVFGEPLGSTSASNVALAVAPGGVFHWGSIVPPYAWGYTNYKWKLDNGPWSAETSVFTAPIINLLGLAEGPHTVYLTGKNDAGYYQDDSFVYPAGSGVPAHVTVSRAWIVNPGAASVRLNEILAQNERAVPVNGRYPDLVELYNPGPSMADLSGMSLSDNRDDPRKYVFPSGTTLAAGQYLTVYADAQSAPLGVHLGFGLNQEGDSLFLFGANGLLLDSVAFGLQLADSSIGREADGHWALCVPTFGSANIAAAVGDPHGLKINEWLAAGREFSYDFVELYNPAPLPVPLGGLYLTDNSIGEPNRHLIQAASFIPANGYAVFIADGTLSADARHLSFGLSSERGEVALFGAELNLIDLVQYGSQLSDVSMGRNPNGATNIVALAQPTPGAGNLAAQPPVGTQLVINEVLARNVSALTNIDGSTPEWIELHNPTANTIDLADSSLSDDQTVPRRFVFPAGTVMEPGDYLLVLCNGSQPASSNLAGSYLNTGFGIKATGGGIYLYDPAGSALDWIVYGLQAANFSIGRENPTSTNWVLGVPTPKGANISAALGNPAQLRINEWMAAPSAGADWFEIYNPVAQPVALAGLYLANDLTPAGIIKNAPVPPLSFIGANPDGYLRFWADKQPASGSDHVNFKLSASGESIGLANSNAVLIDAVTFGPQAANASEGRLPDGNTNLVRFLTTATPGEGNYLPLDQVVLSEVLSLGTASPATEQAIEVQNIGPDPLDLGGWFLSNTRRALQKYRIPAGTTLPAASFKVFYQAQFNADPQSSSSFLLDPLRGDNVYLSQVDTNGSLTGYRTVVAFGPAEAGVSFGRHLNTAGQVDFVAMRRHTFGADNAATLAQFRLGAGLSNAEPQVGPVVFSEIMYHPPDLPGPIDNLRDEFLELANIATNPVALYDVARPTNTWHVRGGVDFDFPSGVALGVGQRLLLVGFDPINDPVSLAAFRSAYPLLPTNAAIFGPYSGKLDNGGEAIALNKPGIPQEGIVPYIRVEEVVYADDAPWDATADGAGNSLQRLSLTGYGNEPTNWVAAAPTPASSFSPNLDSDSDGIPDWWMVQYFGHATGQADDLSMANQDADGDGMTNLSEYQAATDPKNPGSLLKAVISNPGLPAVIVFQGQAGKSYSVEYSDALPASWQILWSFDELAASGPIAVTNQAPPGIMQRFYRIVTPRKP